MLLAVLAAATFKFLLTLPVIYLSLRLSARVFALRFADKKTLVRLSVILAVLSFACDLLNIYVVAYSGWENLVKLIPLLGLLILYLAASLFLVWVYLRDTHKKTFRAWLVFAVFYLFSGRLVWMFLGDFLAWF